MQRLSLDGSQEAANEQLEQLCSQEPITHLFFMQSRDEQLADYFDDDTSAAGLSGDNTTDENDKLNRALHITESDGRPLYHVPDTFMDKCDVCDQTDAPWRMLWRDNEAYHPRCYYIQNMWNFDKNKPVTFLQVN